MRLVLIMLMASMLLPSPLCANDSQQGHHITLGTSKVLYSGLIAVAMDQGYFQEAGLDVEIKYYPSGLAALAALSKGEVEIATATEFAITSMVDDLQKLRIVSRIGINWSYEIVARKDKGITKPEDLQGKRIGVSEHTSGEYYLDKFLLTQGIERDHVTLINIAPQNLASALANGDIDALSSWERYSFEAQGLLRDNAVVWSAAQGAADRWLLVYREDQNPGTTKQILLLTAFKKAAEFVLLHKKKARQIIAKAFDMPDDFFNTYWDKTRLDIGLDQSIITTLQTVSRWRSAQTDNPVPLSDMQNLLQPEALDIVDPSSITIFR